MAAEVEGDCSICLGEYKDPRILPCQHVFCLQCLCDYVAEKKQINCPNCMTEVEIPAGGVAALAPYVEEPLQETTEPLQETTEPEVCNVCEKGIQASFQCFECDKCMCDVCKKFHDVFSSKHQVYKLQVSDSEKSFCENHPLVEVQFYCKTCKCLICQRCKKYSHNSKHIVLGIEDYFIEIKKQFKEYQKIIYAKLRKSSEVTDSFISKETQSVHEFMEHVPKLRADLKSCTEIARHREEINSEEDKILSRRLTAAIKHLDKPLNKSENIRDLSLNLESKIQAHQKYLYSGPEDEMGTLDVTTGRLFSFPFKGDSCTSPLFFVGGIHWIISANRNNEGNMSSYPSKKAITLTLYSFNIKEDTRHLVESVTTDVVFTLNLDDENSVVQKHSKTFSPDTVQTNVEAYSVPNVQAGSVTNVQANWMTSKTSETRDRLKCELLYCEPWNEGHTRNYGQTRNYGEDKSLKILFDIKRIEYKEN